MESQKGYCCDQLESAYDDNDNGHPSCDGSLFHNFILSCHYKNPYCLSNIIQQKEDVEEKYPQKKLIVERSDTVIQKYTMMVKIFRAPIAAFAVITFLVHI